MKYQEKEQNEYYLKVMDKFKTFSIKDFPKLGFHDCKVKNIGWNPENRTLKISLDYILEWIKPMPSEKSFLFRISPAMIIFEWVNKAEINIEWDEKSVFLCEIENIIIEKKENSSTHLWTIELSEPKGSISVESQDFTMHLLSEPILSKMTYLE